MKKAHPLHIFQIIPLIIVDHGTSPAGTSNAGLFLNNFASQLV